MRGKATQGAARQRGGVLKSILGFFVGLAVVGLIGGGAAGYAAWREAHSVGPLSEDAVVLLEPGLSVGAIAARLETAGALRYPVLFKAAVRLRKAQGALKAGEYRIPAGASVIDLIDILEDGKSILHYFTAPEGLTSAQILRAVAANETLTGEVTAEPAEGTMLPETYAFTRGESRDGMIRIMMKAQSDALDRLWDGRATDLPFSTREEAIILASIVEKETGVASERGLVASVFVNRLKRRMRLQSDPTIIYGLTGGEPLGRGIRESELKRETPYNTYVIFGLPPTPISNPGLASLEAVLNPPESDYLYFVADGTGGHVFAKTLREHNNNVAAWRRIERERRENG